MLPRQTTRRSSADGQDYGVYEELRETIGRHARQIAEEPPQEHATALTGIVLIGLTTLPVLIVRQV